MDTEDLEGGADIVGESHEEGGDILFRLLHSALLALAAVQAGPDSGHEVFTGYGFAEVIIGALMHSFTDVIAFDPSGEENEGHFGGGFLFADGSEHLVSVHFGHGDIAEDEVGSGCCGGFQPGLPVGFDADVEAFQFQSGSHGCGQVRVIFDDENMGHWEGLKVEACCLWLIVSFDLST